MCGRCERKCEIKFKTTIRNQLFWGRYVAFPKVNISRALRNMSNFMKTLVPKGSREYFVVYNILVFSEILFVDEISLQNVIIYTSCIKVVFYIVKIWRYNLFRFIFGFLWNTTDYSIINWDVFCFRYRIRPRVLQGIKDADSSVDLFGVKLSVPLLVSLSKMDGMISEGIPMSYQFFKLFAVWFWLTGNGMKLKLVIHATFLFHLGTIRIISIVFHV